MKALVVDDSLVARAQIKKVLKEEYPDIEIEEAKCAADAIALLETTDYDIFTIDFNMPGGTGDEVIIKAKARCPTAKIALLTANKQLPMKDKCQEWGVKLLEKPHFKSALLDFLTGTSDT
ncbi:response regulator [Pseudoalteromonas sp. SMS1]|uniref:response regulator transcription factor n=1 Tax=Pseudoalteromonas sp. SMS1 TaxID=2908894 RepID=UPI001F1E2AC7|nr:response regulator [Pseudoalteromonas sp. SMS1]MCF2860047.1 response regulator [Pseudoalteromonas sp. SMS1]